MPDYVRLLERLKQLKKLLVEGAAYNRKIGGGTFEGNDHPGGQKLRFGKTYRYVSAAGAYQFTEETAEEFEKKAGVSDFSPESQDAMAVSLIKEKGALGDVKKGQSLYSLRAAFGKLTKRWSSLPGGSEQNKTLDAEKKFKENVSNELNNNSKIATPKGELKVD